jgi:hypothetical protein
VRSMSAFLFAVANEARAAGKRKNYRSTVFTKT